MIHEGALLNKLFLIWYILRSLITNLEFEVSNRYDCRVINYK